MTRDVYISLRGLQFEESRTDTEQIETVVPGVYYEKNGRHYVIYDEELEGFEQPVKNTVKFAYPCLELTRRGPVNVRMVFEENKKNTVDYHTPYGTILLGIYTKKIHIAQESDRIVVNVDYSLDIYEEFYAGCKLVMDIRSTENG